MPAVAEKSPKAKVPNHKQLSLLEGLTGKRKVVVTEDGRGRKATITTMKGKAIEGATTTTAAVVAACVKAGWLINGDEGGLVISDAGKKARKSALKDV